MALAASLIPGFQYRVTAGMLEDTIVSIVDNKPFADGDVEGRQRKITILHEDGTLDYILPRLLEDQPCGVARTDLTTTPVPAVESAALTTAPAAVSHTGFTTAAPITDPMDARLDHLRPSRAKVKKYMKRSMPNGMTDIEFLLSFTNDEYRADNESRPQSVMLKGDTQSGKTFLVEALAVAWADSLGLPKPMPIFTLSGSSGVTDFDLFGQTTSYTDPATGQESLVWLPGIVDLAAQCGGILYLDEVNMMVERVTSSLHPLCDHRHHFVNRNKPVLRGGTFMPDTVSASLDLWIIGTYNEGYRGGGELNEAFNNRFRTIMWDYDDEIERKLIDSVTVRLLGDALRTARKANKIRTPIGTSALQGLQRDVATFGPEMACQVLLGMFKGNERDIVDSIITDRSIIVLLHEELKQQQADAAGTP